MATARFSGSRIEFVLDRGGSVRLIGDDQQLAAIGAGGVLRDIQATHGAVQLNELVRFADPGEGAASLALRAGDPEALGFYLDNHRVHVGDLGTCADQVFDAWLTARHAGADALMVAPTRMLVAELNARAQADLRGGVRPTRTVALADGSDAAVGDVIITRVNDRRLRTSGTDWVRNGDRWNITGIATNGDLRAIHQTNRQTVILPAAYVTGLLRHRPRLQRWDRGRERVDRTPPPHRQRLPQPRQLSATHAPHRRRTEPGPTAGMKSRDTSAMRQARLPRLRRRRRPSTETLRRLVRGGLQPCPTCPRAVSISRTSARATCEASTCSVRCSITGSTPRQVS